MREQRGYASGTKLESVVGYSRAVRGGDCTYVTGTTPAGHEGSIVGRGP